MVTPTCANKFVQFLAVHCRDVEEVSMRECGCSRVCSCLLLMRVYICESVSMYVCMYVVLPRGVLRGHEYACMCFDMHVSTFVCVCLHVHVSLYACMYIHMIFMYGISFLVYV